MELVGLSACGRRDNFSFGFLPDGYMRENLKNLGNVLPGAGLGFGSVPVKFAHLHDLHFPICVSEQSVEQFGTLTGVFMGFGTATGVNKEENVSCSKTLSVLC